MRAVCASRHDPSCITEGIHPSGGKDVDSRALPALLGLLNKAMGVMRNIIQQQTTGGIDNNKKSSLNWAERRRVEKAATYMSARLSGRNEDVLRLVADDVVLKSSRDGIVAGKSHLRDYLSRVKAVGSWGTPTWNRSIGVAEVTGHVRILMVNVAVMAQFGFDRHEMISKIDIATRRKVSQ